MVTAASLLVAAALATSAWNPPAVAQQTIELPAPRMSGGMPLMEALARRQSVRAYADRACRRRCCRPAVGGVRRQPAAERRAHRAVMARLEGDRHLCRHTRGGVALRAGPHALRRVMDGDIREATGRQPFPATAPVVLIYVADRTRMAEAPAQDQHLYAHVDAALVAQNVYLFAAAEGSAPSSSAMSRSRNSPRR
jgi:nitroreductase